MSEVLIKSHHVHEAGLCMRGARQWLALHGMDINELIQTGIPCSRVEALNDVLGNKVVEIARAEAAGDEA